VLQIAMIPTSTYLQTMQKSTKHIQTHSVHWRLQATTICISWTSTTELDSKMAARFEH